MISIDENFNRLSLIVPEDVKLVVKKIVSIFINWFNKIDKNKEILELGCGNGTYSRVFAYLGCSVTAVDIHLQSLLKLKDEDKTKSINIIQADVSKKIIINNKKFDIIICSEVLEHLDDPKKTLSIIKDHLKSNGMAFITVPNGFGPWEIWNRILKRPWLTTLLYLPFYWPIYLKKLFFRNHKDLKKIDNYNQQSHCTLNDDSGHVQFWTFREFSKLLRKSGFKIIKVRNSSINFQWLPFYYRLKGNFLDQIDIKLADYLSHYFVSGWIFLIKKVDAKIK